MADLRAVVIGGNLVLCVPTDLPEGTEIELSVSGAIPASSTDAELSELDAEFVEAMNSEWRRGLAELRNPLSGLLSTDDDGASPEDETPPDES